VVTTHPIPEVSEKPLEATVATQLTLFTMVPSAPASNKILTTFLWFRAAAT
jgi:hypothetical protein